MLHAFRPSGGAGGASHVDAVARWLWASPHAAHSQAAGPAAMPALQRQPSVRPAAAPVPADQLPDQELTQQAERGSSAAQQPAEVSDAQLRQAETALAEDAAAAAAVGAAAFTDPASAFAEAARRHADRVGVIHLALHARKGGLVTAWRQQVQAIAEPGAYRQALLRYKRAKALRWDSLKEGQPLGSLTKLDFSIQLLVSRTS